MTKHPKRTWAIVAVYKMDAAPIIAIQFKMVWDGVKQKDSKHNAGDEQIDSEYKRLTNDAVNRYTTSPLNSNFFVISFFYFCFCWPVYLFCQVEKDITYSCPIDAIFFIFLPSINSRWKIKVNRKNLAWEDGALKYKTRGGKKGIFNKPIG